MKRIEYWVQDTIEAGHWELTAPVSQGYIDLCLKIYDSGRVVELDHERTKE